MKRVLLVLLIALFGIPGGALSADESEGFTLSLFDGRTMAGWHVAECDAVPDDGAILLQAGDGFIRSDQRYGDFVLELDWLALQDKDWDSGIYIRCELPAGGKHWPDRYQVNLRQGQEGNLIGFKAATSQGLAMPGAWNHFKLTVVGATASLEINGQAAWQVAGIEAPTGYIGFQSEVPLGGQFKFRNIQITELGHKPLFNGLDLAGWEGAGGNADDCWNVEDGAIVGLEKSGPWLRTREQFGDFNLRLQYRVDPGANSGVYLRVPASGDHHGKDAGVEIQILDDRAEKYAKLQPYQYCGSIYAVAPATMHVGLPSGSWNNLEINCAGPDYRVTHNGVVIIAATVEQFPQLDERLRTGFLGLQNHGGGVAFRNLRIGEPLP